jgi:hypothetical protein
MSIKTTLKASVAAAALIAVAAPVISSPAEAGLKNGNDNSVTISGSLNRALMYADNGTANDWSNVDGGTDNSRLRILVSGKLTDSIDVGGVWEANLPISNSQGLTSNQGADDGATTNADQAFKFRKTEVTFTHATMGKLSIGQSSTASDNKPSLDGTVNNNAGISHGGGMMVFDKTANANTAVTSGAAFASYFGGRKDRVRYDTPSIMGIKGSAAMGDDSFWDVGLTYGATYGDIQIAAAAQYANLGTDSSTTATSKKTHGSNQYGVGLALKHASGLSAGAHWGEEGGNSNAANGIAGHSWGVEAGYTTSAVSNLGATAFSVIYTAADATFIDDYEAETVSFHVKQSMPSGVDVYASYENASFEDNNAGTALEDLSVFLIGTKLSF